MADVLVEREDFLVSLERLLGEALDGSGRLVFLGGEAGVGKTALATALAETAGGPAVRRGSCDNVTTAEALGPIMDALPELAAAADHEAGVSRLRLFQQVREVLAESPMLLVLEDVHWADEATLDILRFLGRPAGWGPADDPGHVPLGGGGQRSPADRGDGRSRYTAGRHPDVASSGQRDRWKAAVG